MMQAFEVMGNVDKNGQLLLDQPLEIPANHRVKIIILLTDDRDLDDTPTESRPQVKITSFPVSKTDVDETEYLLQSEANRKKLLQAIENVKHRENLVEVQLDDDESF